MFTVCIKIAKTLSLHLFLHIICIFLFAYNILGEPFLNHVLYKIFRQVSSVMS